MTSNQLTYWRNEEDKRANKAREAENYRSNTAKEAENYRSNVAKEAENLRHNTALEQENVRHNVTQEEISKVQNELTARGLDIKDKQLISELASLYMDKGPSAIEALPDDLQEKLNEAYEVNTSFMNEDRNFNTWVTNTWEEIKRFFTGAGRGVIAKLF